MATTTAGNTAPTMNQSKEALAQKLEHGKEEFSAHSAGITFRLTFKDRSYHDMKHRVREELKRQGFEIVNQFKVHNLLHDKMDRKIGHYTILSIVAPPLLSRSLSENMTAGCFQPWNVCIYESAGLDGSVLEVQNPSATAEMYKNPIIREIATEATYRLHTALDLLQKDWCKDCRK